MDAIYNNGARELVDSETKIALGLLKELDKDAIINRTNLSDLLCHWDDFSISAKAACGYFNADLVKIAGVSLNALLKACLTKLLAFL